MGALFVVASIVVLIGFVMVLIQAFRVSMVWGLAILGGNLALGFLFGPKVWANLAGVAIVVAFAVQHWDEVKRSFIVYAAGCVLAIPLLPRAEKMQQDLLANAEKQKAITARPVEASALTVPAPQPYTPPYTPPVKPPAQAAPVQEEEPTLRVAQVFADNQTKLYYELDCAKRPPNAYAMAKSLAKRQGYKPGPCP